MQRASSVWESLERGSLESKGGDLDPSLGSCTARSM